MRYKYAWPGVLVIAVLAGATVPLLFNPGFYYVDDTQSGAFGQWYEIGRRFLAGDWSFVNPRVWQSGNYLAEGAWGIFSPVLWLVGIGAQVTSSALVFSTAIKIACLLVAAIGVYVLARDFGAHRPWAALVAVAAPLAGFTLYMDAASWVNGLMAWSLWPLAWGLARRAIFRAKSPVAAIAASASLVGIGYVHATIFLGIALGAVIVEALVLRHRPSTVRAFAMATAAGLFALVVHLPGLLTAPVTGRSGGVSNNGLLTTDLSGLAASAVPVGTPSIRFFDGSFPDAPLLYIAWFLPLLAFVDWRRLPAILLQRRSVLVVLVCALVGVLLPSDFGPLRFPVRLMPYVSVAVLIIFAVALSRARAPKLSARRFQFAAGWVLVSGGLAFSADPEYVKMIAACTAVSLLVLWILWRVLSGRSLPLLGRAPAGRTAGRESAVVSVIGITLTVVFLIPQHLSSPRSPLPDYGIPNDVDDYQGQLDDGKGDALVVGGVPQGRLDESSWSETLVGNLWYLTEADVQNAYSAVYYTGYNSRTCMTYNGSTCGLLYLRLFEKQPETGEMLVDLMGVSTVQIMKEDVPESDWSFVADGWSIVDDNDTIRVVTRDTPVDGAGSVVWQSAGTAVTVVDDDAMGVTFAVDAVPSEGGEVALSRIPWPGYQATGARVMDDPVDGFLLGVEIEASQVGEMVTVSYWAPGWQVQAASLILLALILLAWPILRLIGKRRTAAPGRLARFADASRRPAHGADQ